MNRKICFIGIIGIFMLVTISITSSVVGYTEKVEKKESPLYQVRTTRAIGEKINQIFYDLKTKFLGERIFCIPITLFRILQYSGNQYFSCTDCPDITCQATFCLLNQCTNDFGCTIKTCDLVTSPDTCNGFTCYTSVCGCDD